MRAQAAIAAMLLSWAAGCWALPEPPKESLKIRLTDEFVEMVHEDSLSAWASSDTTDLDLPAIPIYRVPIYPPAGRTASPLDTITVKAIITKRGNVKRAWIESSDNVYFNKATLKSVVQWRFQPALRKGVPVDTIMSLPIRLKPD